MEKSRGTKYENFSNELTVALVEHIVHDVAIDQSKKLMVEVFVVISK
ncbi:MAG: hypothetical protein HC905_24920 [Bacteroidales bacterium]|nr:hypothetical protein [Bacteroidales bacterium]